MVNFDGQLQTTTGIPATLVKVLEGRDDGYQHLVSFVDDGVEYVDVFDEDGDGLYESYTLENVPERPSYVAPGAIVLPSILQKRVYHTKLGAGNVTKIREHATKPMMVKTDSGREVWALSKNISAA